MAFTLDTERLMLREFTRDDAPFMLRQLNEPSFIANIADRGVRTLEHAAAYLEDGPIGSYRLNGFGFWAVVEKSRGSVIGMCGLVKRDNLPDPDLGYAFLPEYFGKGLAFEAAQACLHAAKRDFALPRLLAIVNPDNQASRRLLDRLGFTCAGMHTMKAGEPELCLYRLGLEENPPQARYNPSERHLPP
jgi:RimJ/RimL family protein N-acetyltransferase